MPGVVSEEMVRHYEQRVQDGHQPEGQRGPLEGDQ